MVVEFHHLVKAMLGLSCQLKLALHIAPSQGTIVALRPNDRWKYTIRLAATFAFMETYRRAENHNQSPVTVINYPYSDIHSYRWSLPHHGCCRSRTYDNAMSAPTRSCHFE